MTELSHHTGNGLEDLYAILKARDVMVEQLRLDLIQDNVRIILDGQRDITEFDISSARRSSQGGYYDLMQAVGASINVKYIWMLCGIDSSFDSCVQLCRALCVNHTVSALRLELSGMGHSLTFQTFETILNQVAVMIGRNKGLKYFACKYSAIFGRSSSIFWSLDGAADALKRNHTLEHLEMSGIDVHSGRGLIHGLIQPLTADAIGRQTNSTLVKLHLTLCKEVEGESLKAIVDSLARMLQSNTSLKELYFSSPQDYSVATFEEALKMNHTLENLRLATSTSVLSCSSPSTENKEVTGSSEQEVEADDSKGRWWTPVTSWWKLSKMKRMWRPTTVKRRWMTVNTNDSEDYNLTNSTEQEGPRSPFHSQGGRSSIPALDKDASCSQVLQDVHREFHELGLLETAKNKKKQRENQIAELKSFSESLKEPNLTKVDGPSTYLELGTKSLKNIENMISIQSSDSELINQLQCHYLFYKLRESLNDAKACIDGSSPQDIQRSCCILESLAQTWKEGEILVGDCCDAQWIRAAMILANAKEHFTSLVLKLRLYMQLFQSIFKEGATKEFLIKLQDRKWSDDVKDEEFPIIDAKALEDRQRLLSRLIEVGSIDSENLIKRLNHPGKIDAWKVAHKSIQRVPHGQIGKGASAIVHKVVWLGKHFAEKCFSGPESKHFQEEASLLAGLSHPNILPLFCFVTKADSCSLVTELMDGDLDGLMRRRLDNNEIQGAPFKLLEAIDIMLQVAEGMHYLHQNRVVHRDLKAMNILVKCNEHDRHVYAKVADFGLSKTKESSCTYSNLTIDKGSTRWMAPELFGNSDQSVPIRVHQETEHSSLSNEQISKKHPFKVDIYSFGMVCHEILTGYVPFHDHASMKELRKKIKDGLRPNLPEQCPQQLSKLIQACYHSDPATRPSFFEICVELRHIKCSLMIGGTL